MTALIAAASIAVLLLSGRKRAFDSLRAASRIPPQQEYSPGPDPDTHPSFMEMGDPRADDCIVRDVSPTIEGAGWRWTHLDPTLRFYLKRTEHRVFMMDFTIVAMAFQQTGPVTLSCYINDKLLAKVNCSRPGDYHLKRPVPASWLHTGDPNYVRAVLDKVWTAPADGARLGYVLLRAGFPD